MTLIVVVVLTLGYLAWFGLLCMGSTEGDTPAASSFDLPAGATVLAAEEECGSGGCWSTFTVRPGSDTSAADLARRLETTFDGRIPGTFTDPRTVNFMTATEGANVVITASYWITYDNPR
jgi:hypothetical protein